LKSYKAKTPQRRGRKCFESTKKERGSLTTHFKRKKKKGLCVEGGVWREKTQRRRGRKLDTIPFKVKSLCLNGEKGIRGKKGRAISKRKANKATQRRNRTREQKDKLKPIAEILMEANRDIPNEKKGRYLFKKEE